MTIAGSTGTVNHPVVSLEQWLAARKELLTKEKELTRLRDELSRRRRELPWVRVEKAYEFEGPEGRETLAQLFENRGQLVVYHFMFAPEWDEGCKHCSFWADHFDSTRVHLNHRDVTLAVVSRAPFAKIEAFRRRMGWGFKWVSSFGSDFNRDFGVSFTPEEVQGKEAVYNFTKMKVTVSELQGVSVFFQDESGTVFRAYSTYARGIDMLNGTYQFLDLVPKGRDEDGLSSPQAWVQYHDRYPA